MVMPARAHRTRYIASSNSFSVRNPLPSLSASSQICSKISSGTARVVDVPLANDIINSPASSPSSVPLLSASAALKSAEYWEISTERSKGHSMLCFLASFGVPSFFFSAARALLPEVYVLFRESAAAASCCFRIFSNSVTETNDAATTLFANSLPSRNVLAFFAAALVSKRTKQAPTPGGSLDMPPGTGLGAKQKSTLPASPITAKSPHAVFVSRTISSASAGFNKEARVVMFARHTHVGSGSEEGSSSSSSSSSELSVSLTSSESFTCPVPLPINGVGTGVLKICARAKFTPTICAALSSIAKT
mmetsp:Transcript_5237/g.19598  ORF Transcript_5237/g.19598 Transcript_5237/m.19598 type:complete len:305 (+) Transcript_5237:3907-4821(+)